MVNFKFGKKNVISGKKKYIISVGQRKYVGEF